MATKEAFFLNFHPKVQERTQLFLLFTSNYPKKTRIEHIVGVHSGMNRLILPLTCALLLGACSNIFKDKKDPLQGERQVVFLNQDALKVDASTPAASVRLDKPEALDAWPMASGFSHHKTPVSTLASNPQELWRTSLDTSVTSELLNGPVIAQNMVFATDGVGNVTAVNLENGTLAWRTDTLDADKAHQPFGGGVAWDAGRLYVTTAGAEILCLDAKDGKILWRQALAAPARSAPTLHNGRVFVATINNQLSTLKAEDGSFLWSHAGIMETAGLLGGASPAVQGNTVVVTYTSGEVFALTADNGYPLWSESLNSPGAVDSLSSLAHIKARPIIHDGIVYLVSHAGKTSAIDLRSGRFVWSRQFGGIRTPALSNGFLFLITNDDQVVCCESDTGRVVWVKQLPAFQNFENNGEPLLWAGPVLVNDSLIFTGSNGKLIYCSAQSGEITKVMDVGTPLYLSPLVAQKTLVLLAARGELIAYR